MSLLNLNSNTDYSSNIQHTTEFMGNLVIIFFSYIRLEELDGVKRELEDINKEALMAERRVRWRQNQHDRFYQLRDDKGRNILMAIIE